MTKRTLVVFIVLATIIQFLLDLMGVSMLAKIVISVPLIILAWELVVRRCGPIARWCGVDKEKK